jgi:nitronate monooxygenase
MNTNWLRENLKIKYPIILSPMFLVSNEKMLISAVQAGITACIPALNYRTLNDFEKFMKTAKSKIKGPFGINLIANKSNNLLNGQIEICEKYIPDFIITSLGSPKEIISKCRPKGTLVFCDVVDSDHAKKVSDLKADAIIAVNSGAGGHAGNIPASVLIPKLKKETTLPIISAGGVATGEALLSTLVLGATGVSIGSPFIACSESEVSSNYKNAIFQHNASDIVMTDKISGTPCTVINTEYMKKIGTKQNMLESYLNKNKQLKKYAKMLTYYRGMKALEKATFGATYKTVWCAGPSIEFTSKEENIEEIVKKLITEYNNTITQLQSGLFQKL